MSTNNKRIILVVSLLFTFANVVMAADYITLEQGLWAELDMGNGSKISTTNLGDFLGKAFNFGIAIAVALSVIMITLGGIQYMTTDSWSKKEDGKQRIRQAFLGLGLALISWLILYTINPCLVNFTGDGCSNSIIK